MRIIILIIVSSLAISCSNKQAYNDCFELNLKGNPKSITEYQIYSLSDIISDSTRTMNESSIDVFTSINSLYFDSTGNIHKSFNKYIIDDSNGYWLDYSSQIKNYYTDSIIITDKNTPRKEKLVFDKKGLLSKRITIVPIRDTTLYFRNSNRITINKINTHYVRDTRSIIECTFKLNKNNDIIKETIKKELYFAIGDTTEYKTDIFDCQYIYDNYGNWIIKITKENDKINLITQRKIEY